MSNRMRTFPWLASFLALLSFVLFSTAFSTTEFPEPPETHVNAVWVGQTDGMLKVATTD